MRKNQRNLLMDLNSEITVRQLQSQLAAKELPHYYMLYTSNPVAPTRCCGTLRDLEDTLEYYPNAKWEKVYVPIPQTVNVTAETVVDPLALPTVKLEGQEIPVQNNLPQSEAKKLEL